MKTYGGVGVLALPLLTSALDGDEWSASLPCRFAPGQTASGIHWIGGLVGLRAGLDGMKIRKFLPLPGI
jgi:hypothetical protein